MKWASKELLEFYHCYCREKLAIRAIRHCYLLEEPKFWVCTFKRSEHARRYSIRQKNVDILLKHRRCNAKTFL